MDNDESATAEPPMEIRRQKPSSPHQPEAKRQKKFDKIGEDVRWLLFAPYDNLFGYVRVDRKVLANYDCRSSKMVNMDPPHAYYEDFPVWYVGLTHCQLIAFVKSLHGNELVIPSDTTYKDVVRMLDYEGIGIPGMNEIKEPEMRLPMLHPKSQALASYSADETNAQQVVACCTFVANAIVEWPRPRIMMEGSFNGGECSNQCSSTRFWVRFAPAPKLERYGGDEIFQLARKQPRWLHITLQAIGFVHCELSRRGDLDKHARDATAFGVLTKFIKEQDTVRHYLSVKRDMPQQHRNWNRDVIRHSDKWAAWVLSTADAHGSANDMVFLSPGDERRSRRGHGDSATCYARAAIALAEDLVRRMPNLRRIFDGRCSDDDKRGVTPERKVLEKALKQRGVKVVRWRDDSAPDEDGDVPLIFPPALFSSLISNGPCVLLEF